MIGVLARRKNPGFEHFSTGRLFLATICTIIAKHVYQERGNCIMAIVFA